MADIHAGCSCLDLVYVRAALADLKKRPTKAIMGPEQVAAWEQVAVKVGAVELDPKEFPEFPSPKMKMSGIPIEMRRIEGLRDKVLFLDADDKIVAKIECLAIPVEFHR